MDDWIQPGSTSALTAIFLGAIGIGLLVWRRGAVRETTLTAPWYWCIACVAALAVGETIIGCLSADSSTWHEPLRYSAATLVFCPTMALLGAKRPQDRAWHVIVVSLWGILILPAFEQFVFQPDQPMEIHDARSWFLVALIFVSLVNMLPTRFWHSALLQMVGQSMLLAAYLPFSVPRLGTAGVLIGFLLLIAAIVSAASCGRRSRGEIEPVDRLWLDFRDSFGTLWALRVAERVNAAAATNKWNVVLAWNGFYVAEPPENDRDQSPEISPAIQQSLKNLLRRFVSKDWIDRRLNEN